MITLLFTDPDARGEGGEEDVVADPGGVGVLDGDGVGGHHDGGGKVHHAPPLVGGVVTGDAAYNVECSRAASI